MKKSKIIKQLQAQLEIERATNKTLNEMYLQEWLVHNDTRQHLKNAEYVIQYQAKYISMHQIRLPNSV